MPDFESSIIIHFLLFIWYGVIDNIILSVLEIKDNLVQFFFVYSQFTDTFSEPNLFAIIDASINKLLLLLQYIKLKEKV